MLADHQIFVRWLAAVNHYLDPFAANFDNFYNLHEANTLDELQQGYLTLS